MVRSMNTIINKEKILLIEYEIERVINKQLFEEKHITYDIYQKVNGMILKDIELQMQKLDSIDSINNIKSEFKENSQSDAV